LQVIFVVLVLYDRDINWKTTLWKCGKIALTICGGLRPKVAKRTPKCYIELVEQCLDADPDERPSSKEILKKIRNCDFMMIKRILRNYFQRKVVVI
jgi:hypothetical protein